MADRRQCRPKCTLTPQCAAVFAMSWDACIDTIKDERQMNQI
jgi:hypothetical protein